MPSINTTKTTTTTTPTTPTSALNEIYNSFGGGNVLCDKSHMEHVTTVINTLEKKKIKYKIVPMPMCGEDGLEITFAIVVMVDKKNTKRNKKSISNNKYILFNSWYTKNRSASWPNSHIVWNLMKTQPLAKPFVDIFDFMEKLGKSINTKAAIDSTTKVVDVNNNDIDGSGIYQRYKLYEEFYKITTYTFTHNAAPTSSFIYDIRLNKIDDETGLNKLNRQMLEEGIAVFKNILSKQDPSIASTLKQHPKNSAAVAVVYKENTNSSTAAAAVAATTATKNSRKRSATAAAAAKPVKKGTAKKVRETSTSSPVLTMEDDQTDDTQMSYS
ncbi:nuclear matrix associated phosphoprotein [Alphabaculovirus altersperidaniae]|uniref:Nuclear matrix associated phosphoprotein n=1 Tax=Spodoptera eridania nucleopolyhedrovirus TaxID=2315721 RepID=A0ABX6TQ12_9ABAC|nr:nuclear matrix associated phosphoprotein [Spodoptera eridania nucleopolyhedrovirus]QNV47841.1 nuclear matrix associated phosphoprotein [Spodoptera eridania nucleopolyhedrovirus]